jgi:hypothetical protein
MSTSTQDREAPRVKYGGRGRGWFVTRRVTLDGYPQTITLAGPFTSRAQAVSVAREQLAPAGSYSTPRQCPVCALSFLSRGAYHFHVIGCHDGR